MKKIFLIVFLIVIGCSKPKTVFICGDHVCVNNAEAEQFFEENLSIEVKIIDKKKKKETDLVQLNLRDTNNQRSVSVEKKDFSKKKIKTLSNDEIKKIKKGLKEKKNKIISKKVINNEKKTNNKILNDSNNQKNKIKSIKRQEAKLDICKKIKNCNIKEISEYLIKEGKNKKFPDINYKGSDL